MRQLASFETRNELLQVYRLNGTAVVFRGRDAVRVCDEAESEEKTKRAA